MEFREMEIDATGKVVEARLSSKVPFVLIVG